MYTKLSAGSRCFTAVRSFFIFLLLLIPEVSPADDDIPEVEVKVIGKDLSSEIPSAEQVDLQNTTSVYTSIDVSSKKGEVSSVSEVLEREAGIQVKSAGSPGNFATVSIRGTSSNQIAVYIDGIPLNSGRGGYVDLSEIPLEAVQSIDVFKNSSPGEFPEGGIGGVINIRTKREGGGDYYTSSAVLESFSTFRAGLTGFNILENGDVYYSGTYFSTKGDFPFLNDQGTEYNLDDDKEDFRENNDSTQISLETRLRLFSGEDTVISLSENLSAREQGVPGRMNNQTQNARFSQQTSMLNVSIEKGDPESEEISTVLRTYWKFDRDEFRDLDGEVNLSSLHVRSDISESGLFALMKKPFNIHTVTANCLFSNELFRPQILEGSSSHAYIPYPSSRSRGTCTVSEQADFGNVIFTGTLRGMIVRNSLESSSFSDSETEHAYSWQAGVKYHINSRWSLKGNIGTYYRLPSMGELFGDWGFFLGSPDLEPEKGLNAEFSAEGNLKGEKIFTGLEEISFTLFRMDITDYIAYIFNAQGIGRPANIGKAEITGIEVSAQHRAGGISYRHSLTFQQPIDRTRIDYNYGNILPGRFQFSYNGEFSWDFYPKWRFFSGILVETGTYYDSPNLRPAPDKFPVGIGAEYQADDDLKCTLRVGNIFDSQYEDYGGYPLPGRMYSISVDYKF